MDELLKQCDAYFKQDGFVRLFMQMRSKYESLGYLGGTVHISNLSEIEKQTLNGFLRMDLTHHESLHLSIKKIKKLLLDTKFAEIDLETIVFYYYRDDEIQSKRSKQDAHLKQQQDFFETLFLPFQNTFVGVWIDNMKEEGIPILLLRRYEADQCRLKVELNYVFHALNQLPIRTKTRKHMPVFASEITGNPHAFDEGSSMFSLLIQGICYLLHIPYMNNMDAEAKMNVLYEAGILKDDISSFAITYGFYAFCGNQEIAGWHHFAKQKEPLLVSLANLYDVTAIKAKPIVYVIENPSVFSSLVAFSKENKIDHVSFMCTYGQLRVASIQILDILTQGGQCFYYAGDFDPEGLQIAQKLLQRYGQSCTLWHYDSSDYQLAISNEAIDLVRERKLSSIIEPSLLNIKACLEEKKRNAYQECLIPIYQEDILKKRI